jgi:hypothetical protein
MNSLSGKIGTTYFSGGVDLLVLPDFIIDTYCGPYIGLTEPFK